ncbi:Actin-related protein 6 [Rhodotorula toruloides]|uniref:Actin-like protein ARP6 n=1 Tax=Rhodotorula toruloides TaxID=5286 RepID=A0A2T0A2Y0_RHOTO|nr:Actin family [Rhodotorula toruloides]
MQLPPLPSTSAAPQPRVLVLDNGGHSIKAAWAQAGSSAVASEPMVETYRNAIARSKAAKRSFVADELADECDDFGGLTFRVPMERGILNNWEVEKTVWDRVFGSRGRGLSIAPQDTNLLVTEPVFNLPNVQDHYDQIVFEEYEFQSYLRCPGPAVVPYGLDARGSSTAPVPECALIIDSGFSFTHVVPVLRGRIVTNAVRRIDIGGKLMTNYLKEIVSYRHWYMMDQTSVMEHAKEEVCYVSTQWKQDLETANRDGNPLVRTYVLPDFLPDSTNKLGYVRTGLTPPPASPPPVDPSAPYNASQPEKDEEQLLYLCNERFSVPEVLFNPSTIDMNQAGLAETVGLCISLLPLDLQGMFWSNIVCVGGNAAFQGFGERLQSELRSVAPPEHVVNVTISRSPTTTIASSAASYLSLAHNSRSHAHFPTPLSPSSFVTRQEYLEAGSNACRRKFGAFYWPGGKKGDTEVRMAARGEMDGYHAGGGDGMVLG